MAPSTTVSQAFESFMKETPAHAKAWLVAVEGLGSASALDPKCEHLAYLAVLASLRLDAGIPFHAMLAKKAGASQAEVARARCSLGCRLSATRSLSRCPWRSQPMTRRRLALRSAPRTRDERGLAQIASAAQDSDDRDAAGLAPRTREAMRMPSDSEGAARTTSADAVHACTSEDVRLEVKAQPPNLLTRKQLAYPGRARSPPAPSPAYQKLQKGNQCPQGEHDLPRPRHLQSLGGPGGAVATLKHRSLRCAHHGGRKGVERAEIDRTDRNVVVTKFVEDAFRQKAMTGAPLRAET